MVERSNPEEPGVVAYDIGEEFDEEKFRKEFLPAATLMSGEN